MFHLTLNLLAVILISFGLISCGGKGGGGSGGNPRMLNGGGGIKPGDGQGPADPVRWDIEFLGPRYTGSSGQGRYFWTRDNSRFVYHMMLANIRNSRNNDDKSIFPANPYDNTDGFQIRTAVQDIQDYKVNDETKRFTGDVESGLGGYFKHNHVSSDLGRYKFIYASSAPGLGITQLQNGDLFTVGFVFSGSLPSGNYIYTGINVNGRYDENKDMDVGEFTMSVNFASESEQIELNGISGAGRITGTATINMTNGTFSGSNLMWFYDTNMRGTATINGSFHGAGGNAVSGIYSDINNDERPQIFGAIAGTRN